MPKLKFYWVDAFAEEPFQGNPAAVCFVNGEMINDTTLLQKISAEINLSETVFVRQKDSIGHFDIRWFTPEVEVPLCGHGTLAAASVVRMQGLTDNNYIEFDSLSGKLRAAITDYDNIVPPKIIVCLDFPESAFERLVTDIEVILKPLGLVNADVVNSVVSQSTQMVLLQLKSREKVISIVPNFELLKRQVLPLGALGLIVTAHDVQCREYDFISRYFGPWEGIREDAVTGSAHTLLAPYWNKILNKNKMRAYQASARGGYISVELMPNGRVHLTGTVRVLVDGFIST